MPAYSVAKSKLRAIEIKQRRARVQAKLGMKDFKAKHPAWVREAQAENPSYTLMDKEIKEECLKKQKTQETFERKLHENG